jgi:hypothetical protein
VKCSKRKKEKAVSKKRQKVRVHTTLRSHFRAYLSPSEMDKLRAELGIHEDFLGECNFHVRKELKEFLRGFAWELQRSGSATITVIIQVVTADDNSEMYECDFGFREGGRYESLEDDFDQYPIGVCDWYWKVAEVVSKRLSPPKK